MVPLIRVPVHFADIALISSFVLGAVSGIVPAMQAARMNPVDALRS